eukprot:13168265-Ditylum_brightwellii.AAC.1
MAHMRCCSMGVLTIPHAAELSAVITCVGSWGWHLSIQAKHNSFPFGVFTYSAPILASTADDITFWNTSHAEIPGSMPVEAIRFDSLDWQRSGYLSKSILLNQAHLGGS